MYYSLNQNKFSIVDVGMSLDGCVYLLREPEVFGAFREYFIEEYFSLASVMIVVQLLFIEIEVFLYFDVKIVIHLVFMLILDSFTTYESINSLSFVE